MATASLAPWSLSSFTLTNEPTTEQLHFWWEAMRSDDLSVAYADAFPGTLTDFRLEIAQGTKLLLICVVDGDVAGALWLHDLLRRPNGTILAGWVGGYFVPPYRGRHAVRLWKAACQWWEAMDIPHLFAATHQANRRSQAFITRGMGFHRVGRYPSFTTFQGQATDVVIYCARPGDASLAWTCAQRRALRPVQPVTHARKIVSTAEEKPCRRAPIACQSL
jgi:RimJ/RimL family protein N-acetyltransferase